MKSRVKSILIISFIVTILITALSLNLTSSSKSTTPYENFKKEILKIFNSNGKIGVIKFTNIHTDTLDKKFIIQLSNEGVSQRKEAYLLIALYIAETLNHPTTLAKVYFKAGEYNRLVSNTQKATKLFNKSLELYQKLNDFLGQAHVYLNQGVLVYASGKKSEALPFYEKALQIYQKSRYKKGQADSLMRIGEVYWFTKGESQGLDFYDQAIKIYKEIGHEDGLASVYLRKGHFYFEKIDTAKSIEFYKKALKIFEKTHNIGEKAQTYLYLGDFYLSTGTYSKAREMYNSAKPLFESLKNLQGIGNSYFGKGDLFHRIGEYEDAIRMYDKALIYFKEAGEPNGQGNVFFRKGEIYFKMSQYSKSLNVLKKAEEFFKRAGSKSGLANIFSQMGDIYGDIGSPSKSLEFYNKASLLYHEIGSLVGLGNTSLNQGAVYFLIGQNRKALELVEEAQNIFTKGQHIWGIGASNRLKGEILRTMGKHKQARKALTEGLEAYEEVHSEAGIADTLLSLGQIEFIIGNNSRALLIYNECLKKYEELKSPIGIGSVYHLKAELVRITGENFKALTLIDLALRHYREADYIMGMASIHNTKAKIFLGINLKDKALDQLWQSLELFKKAEEPRGQSSAYHEMGNIYFSSKKFDLALEMYDRALAILKNIEFPNLKADINKSMGNVFYHKKNFKKAREFYSKALGIYKSCVDQLGQGNVLRSLGEIYLESKDFAQAQKMFESSLTLYLKINDIHGQAFTLHGKALALDPLGKQQEALHFHIAALEKVEKVRSQGAHSMLKLGTMDKFQKEYRETVEFLLKDHKYDLAFKYAESMKARVFLDQMTENIIPLKKGISLEQKTQHDNLVGKLSALQRQIYELPANSESKRLEELKHKYNAVETELLDLEIRIRAQNPLYASVKYPKPIDLKELQTKVLRTGEVLIEYLFTKDAVYAFLISPIAFQTIKLDFRPIKTEAELDRYLKATRANNTREMNRYGKKLYKKLFHPLKQWMDGKKVIIIPDGKLSLIPFESLIAGKHKETGRHRYLVDDYRIKYIQSASTLALLRRAKKPNKRAGTFGGFGDPVYDFESFKAGTLERSSLSSQTEGIETIRDLLVERYSRQGGILHRLKGSGEEVNQIAKLFQTQGKEAQVYLRGKATEDAAKHPDMKQFDYIHFACHGLLSDDFQSLVLSQDMDAKEDGYLTLGEIMNCDYNAQLIVLSACRSGVGKLEKGEGMVGLTRAMMYAGTPAVVASLWNVSDKGAKELMIRFYKKLLDDKLPKAEALRQAKLELIATPSLSSPYFWSSFVMYGE